ncbi:Lrp/AsnC family transcriptional regulator [Simiduia agarivorans]|uniref:Transcriptional regulator n=1 Tax=Simiduia agarivorans (strain DSM 21679 / JCM 13881 / BCRC 17597 / SA1) TaxID=1117647 RepID=K4KRE5_SIMAS|nr:Lrp/AsnC family transcriptional regulator [Simiduia agarivorans]AFV00861.1 transcriptional regulator [Simiduia agarivorans SA1 = DSM 21679]
MANYIPDATDRKILEILQTNATIPNIELADKVCLSPSPCSRRVKNLRDEGFLRQAVTLLEPAKIGLPVSVFIQVTLNHQVKSDLEMFENTVNEWPEVMECYLMTGDFDYLIRVVVPDLQTYQRFLDDKLTQVPGIDHIKSSFSIKQVRYKTELPLDFMPR